MSTPRAYRPILAQGLACDIMPFAHGAGEAEDGAASNAALFATPALLAGFTKGFPCDTFPLNWPSPPRVGPLFLAKARAEKPSQGAWNPVESTSIKTNDRGISCGNSWFSAFWPCHLQLVWTMTSSAAFWAQGLVRRLPRPRGATCIRVRFWAACSALFATTLTSAASATKTSSAFGPYSTIRPNGQPARLAFFAFAPSALARRRQRQELAHV